MSSITAIRRCPDDGHPLRTAQPDAVPFAFCEHCLGLWFERDAIERADDARADIPQASARWQPTVRRPRSRICPVCRDPLAVVSIDGITIDRCHSCGGVWLDPGEYDAARIRLKLGATAPPRSVHARAGAGSFEAVAIIAEVLVSLLAG
jgi:Zn-finger nucleic acid-binding protein